MANALFHKAREAFLNGDISWVADTIKVVLVDSDAYAVNFVEDEYLSDIPSGARMATSAALTGKTSTAGVADADSLTFPALSGAVSIEAIVIFKDTGDPATSPLIAYLDSVTGLPFTPNGGDAGIIWSSSSNKIFRL